jgi:Undecaprenyl-phosphate galactose phosphotransferase WbaP
MASATVVSTGTAYPRASVPRVRRSPRFCSVIFLLCDAVAITVAASAVLLGKGAHEGASGVQSYLALWPALGVFLVIFASSNLYPGILHNAVTELRRLGLALTISFLVVAGLISVNRSAEYPRRGLLLWWIGAMVITPLCRSAVRQLLCHRPWWGIPVAVFHTGDESAEIIRELEIHPEIGLRPVAILSPSHAIRSRHNLPIPLPILDLRCAAAVRASGVERAIIVLPDGSKLLEELEMFESIFPRLMILHSPAALYSLTVDARPIGGSLAVEVRRDLLLPLPRLAKRAIDLVIVGLSLPMVTVMILLLGLMVRLESPGPIFFSHRRIGRDRSTFCIWKIRTMQVNGDELLQRALLQDGVMRDEWTRDRKLRHDPRITRVGRFLRKTSLDELPQVWNVLRGEMSLVGPRPIVEEEVASYGHNFSLYCRVTPGLTGLWQVSGRNMVSSSDRVRLDSYYVRNWSPWLDLHILGRTAKVVLTGRGAY